MVTLRNLVVTFTLSGLWHGAGWNFIIWGFYFGVLLCAEYLLRPRYGAVIRSVPALFRMAITFHLVLLGWVLFRSPSISAFRQYMGNFWSGVDVTPIVMGWTQKDFASLGAYLAGLVPADASEFGIILLMFVGPLLLAETLLFSGRTRALVQLLPLPAKAVLAAGLVTMVTLLGASDAKVFIYFQF